MFIKINPNLTNNHEMAILRIGQNKITSTNNFNMSAFLQILFLSFFKSSKILIGCPKITQCAFHKLPSKETVDDLCNQNALHSFASR